MSISFGILFLAQVNGFIWGIFDFLNTLDGLMYPKVSKTPPVLVFVLNGHHVKIRASADA